MYKKSVLSSLALLCALLPMGALAAETQPVNLIANPSMETAAADGTPANWQNGTWGTNTHVSTYETTGHTGRSLKTTVSAYTDGDAKWYFDAVAVTPGVNYKYSHWYKSDIETEIDVEITTGTAGTTANDVVSYDRIVTVPASANSWSQISGQFIAPANAKTVTFYQVMTRPGYIQIDDASLNVFTPSPFNRAMVSLTFDDGWRNQYTAALPLLNSHNNMKATFYLLSGAEVRADPEYMDLAMFQGLKTSGQEIGSHTIDHLSLISPTLTQEQMIKELTDSRNDLRSLLGNDNAVAQNFATPFGEYSPAVVEEVKKLYRSHRSTDVGYNNKDTFDIYNIKVQNIVDSTTPAEVAAWVAQAQADKTWLVLVYHLVSADPNATTEDYSVTPANLELELAGIQQSGIAVTTVNQAIDEILAQLNPTTPPVAKPGDVNGDNLINIYDLSILSTNWLKPTGATLAQGDLNADGIVNIYDLSILSTNWNK